MNYNKFIKFLKDNDISYFVIPLDYETLHYKYLVVYVKTNHDYKNKSIVFEAAFLMNNRKYAWSNYNKRHTNFKDWYNTNRPIMPIYDEYEGANTLHVCCDTFSKRMFNKIIRQQKWYK